jgi:hypothetical protein
MIRTQRWIPDTCANPATGDSCVFLETWDDSLDPLVRTHDHKETERVCSIHAALSADPKGHYARVVEENKRKNMSWLAARTIHPPVEWKPFWSYDASGTLKVDFGSVLTVAQKRDLQAICDVQFGPGKALVL